jgi:hypothetical protein
MDTSSPLWRGLWFILAVVVGWRQVPAFIESLRPPDEELQKEIGDFFQEWASAKNYYSGLPIYGDLEVSYDNYLGYPRSADQRLAVNINGHPPTAVLLVLPLGRLKYSDALLVWNLASLAAFGASVALIILELRLRISPWTILPAVLLLLICFPFRQHIRIGQLNLVLLMLITAAWAADRRGHPWWAGALIGAATAVKLFPGFIAIYWLTRRQWRPLFAATLAFATLTAVTGLVLGPNALVSYVNKALPALRPSWSAWGNLSVSSVWLKLFDPAATEYIDPLFRSTTLAWLAVCLSSAAIIVTLIRSTLRTDADLGFVLTIMAMLLVSPVTWSHYLVLLLLPGLIIWQHLPADGQARPFFLICLACLWVDPQLFRSLAGLKRGETGNAGPYHILTVMAIPMFALLGWYVLGCRSALVKRQATPLDAPAPSP